MPEIVLLERQLTVARRRLFLQTLVNALVWCTSGGLLLGCLWLLVQPYVMRSGPDWLRWTVAGGVVSASLLAALLLAIRLCPSRLEAALTLDQRFGLKERATSSLLLPSQMRGTPAGQALLEDAGRAMNGLQVKSRFPIRLRWSAAVVPLCALLLAATAIFYDPNRGSAGDEAQNGDERTAAASDRDQDKKLEEAMQKLEPAPLKPPEDAEAKPANQDDIDQEMGKIAHRPRETKEERERRWAELAKLEAEIKKKKDSEKQKGDKLQDQLKKDGNDRLRKKNKEGPAKDLQDALDKGDAQKAQEEVARLSKKLKDDDLSKEDQALLRDQLQDMQKDLERLSRQKDEKQLLQELAEKNEINKETLDREMDEINKNGDPKQDIEKLQQKLNEMAEKGEIDRDAADQAVKQLEQDKKDLQDLKDAADELKQAQDAMDKGEQDKAGDSLQKAGDKLDGKEGQQQQQRLAQKMTRVQQAKQQMARSAGQAGQSGKPGDNALSRRNGGPNKGGVGAGRRPEEKDDRIGFDPTKVDGPQDNRGASEVTGLGPRPDKPKPRNPQDIAEEIKPRSQDAARAATQQKTIQKDAADMTRGFFENLGDQKSDKKK